MSDPSSTLAGASVPLVSVNEGDYVFCAGDGAGTLFVIQGGRVELLRPGASHERLALLGPGDLLGEESAFDDSRRSYDARAVSATTLLPVSAETFPALVGSHPEVAARMIGTLGRRLFEARAALPPPKRLIVSPRFVHPESGAEFPLPSQPEIVVGRADPRTRFQPDIELSSVDTQRSLSRRHARILRDADSFKLVEESRVANGTFVNGQRVTPGGPTPLAHGDEVCFGLIRTIFRTE